MQRDELRTAPWRKSSYSGENGGECVEVAIWSKSSYSGENGGNCVEVGSGVPDTVPVRDSKNPDGPILTFHPEAWTAFLAAVRDDEFGLGEHRYSR